MDCAFTWREHQHVQVFFDQSKCLKAALCIVSTRVFNDESGAPVEFLNQFECKIAFCDVAFIFGGIVVEMYYLLYPQ